jgi:hypothetical protein
MTLTTAILCALGLWLLLGVLIGLAIGRVIAWGQGR